MMMMMMITTTPLSLWGSLYVVVDIRSVKIPTTVDLLNCVFSKYLVI